ncbi:MAG: hypothetical protein ACI9OE_000289 [Mariniflexile sp.]|jgi:hypothetical protein
MSKSNEAWGSRKGLILAMIVLKIIFFGNNATFLHKFFKNN